MEASFALSTNSDVSLDRRTYELCLPASSFKKCPFTAIVFKVLEYVRTFPMHPQPHPVILPPVSTFKRQSMPGNVIKMPFPYVVSTVDRVGGRTS
ncbi:hypothetical protein AVEN_11419-1 [Araneus ventricosus]|uniref:Uncharacterized protein n=1 Tax=Araneus ventricosus TaxID=182803 RepID=A0A4Y2P628_ARAVE|nr:hypothetical protein AVEN_11419-1 [Araneus ventricosus]